MTPIALLCEIVAQNEKVTASAYRDKPGYAALLHRGYLVESGVIGALICDSCEETHTAPVVFNYGQYGHYCPHVGLVPLARSDVQAIKQNLPQLIADLAEVFACKRRKSSALHGQTWRVGAVEADAGEVMLYFHPRLQTEDDARDLSQAFAREVMSRWRLIITASGTLPLIEAASVELDDLVELTGETGGLRQLAQPTDLVGMPRKKSGGRPSEYGAALAEIIRDRTMSGASLDGINAEGKAVLSEFKTRHPGKPVPSTGTIRRHIRKSRGES